MKTPMKQA